MYKTTKINRYGSFSQNNARINADKQRVHMGKSGSIVTPEGVCGTNRKAQLSDGRLLRWKQAMLIRLKRATEGNTNGKK